MQVVQAVTHRGEAELVQVGLAGRSFPGSARPRATPGASEGLHLGPDLEALLHRFFLATMPAASITDGLLVLVQEVIAAMSTSPCPMSTGTFIWWTSWAGTRSGVGRLVIISASVERVGVLRG